MGTALTVPLSAVSAGIFVNSTSVYATHMKNTFKTCLVILIANLLATTALADTRTWSGFSASHQPPYMVAAASLISADEAAARVQSQYGGRILAVETLQRNGKTFYKIKILTRKGVVRVVRINAEGHK